MPGIPASITITLKMSISLQDIPPEKLEKDPVGVLKEWLPKFKAEMEGDPDFGPYVKVSVEVEEAI